MAKARKTVPPVTKKLELSVIQSPDWISDTIYYNCSFCSKKIEYKSKSHQSYLRRLGLPNKIYCNNCVRLRMNTKLSEHTLLFSLRSIPGHYYNKFYSTSVPEGNLIYRSTIKDYMDHEFKIGMNFPVMSYDPETAFWYVDFSRIGRGKRKLKLIDLKKTVAKMICCYNIYHHVHSIRMCDFWGKFDKALDLFYKSRERPENQRLLVPTFTQCFTSFHNHYSKDYDFSQDKKFEPKYLNF